MAEIIIPKPTKKGRRIAAVLLIAAILLTLGFILWRVAFSLRPHTAADFGFADLQSEKDADGDGIDDYTDIMRGARAYIETNPVYSSAYYRGGYPPEGEGVCTDVIWKALDAAGYCFKDLVDADIAAHREAYPQATDSNINFRRVRNLSVFLERNAEVLTTSKENPQDWMPGDIVVFDGHIGICSDKRNTKGLPYLIHHANSVDGTREADDIPRLTVLGHYRWKG